MGIKFSRPTYRPVNISVDEMRRLSSLGWGAEKIANSCNETRARIRYAMKEAGIPVLPRWSQKGERNGFWKGGRVIDKDGYVLIFKPDHPFSIKTGKGRAGYVREHRLVMEGILGRYLDPAEVVHHIDGNKQNNTPANLNIFEKNSDHLAATLKGEIPNWTEDGKRRIKEAVSAAWKTRVASAATREKQRQNMLRRYAEKRASANSQRE
jgi:hypothetical protein